MQNFCAAWGVRPPTKPCRLSALTACTHSIPCRVAASSRGVQGRFRLELTVHLYKYGCDDSAYFLGPLPTSSLASVGDTAHDHNESHASASAGKSPSHSSVSILLRSNFRCTLQRMTRSGRMYEATRILGEGAFGQVYEATSAGSKTVSPHHRRCSMLQGRLLHATLHIRLRLSLWQSR